MKKKILVLLLALIAVFSMVFFVGCDPDGGSSSSGGSGPSIDLPPIDLSADGSGSIVDSGNEDSSSTDTGNEDSSGTDSGSEDSAVPPPKIDLPAITL